MLQKELEYHNAREVEHQKSEELERLKMSRVRFIEEQELKGFAVDPDLRRKLKQESQQLNTS